MMSRLIYSVSLILVITALALAGCSGIGQTPASSPATEAVTATFAPTSLPNATFTLVPTFTLMPTSTATMTSEPTATHVPLADLDLSEVVLQITDFPTGFKLWKKFDGDKTKMQTALAFLGEYNKKGEPLNYVTIYSPEVMNNLQSGNYYVYYGVKSPLQLVTCGVLVYNDEQAAAQAYKALTTGYQGESLDFPAIGTESSGFAFTNPLNMAKSFGVTGLWINGLQQMGVPPELMPQMLYGTRLIWRFHEGVLHLIILSAEQAPLDRTLALAQLMQARIEGKK